MGRLAELRVEDTAMVAKPPFSRVNKDRLGLHKQITKYAMDNNVTYEKAAHYIYNKAPDYIYTNNEEAK